MTYQKITVSPKNTPNQTAQTHGKATPATKPTSAMSYQMGFTSGPTG